MVYSDSHCHLDSYPPEDLDIVFAQMKVKNVVLVLNVSISLETSEETVKLAQSHDNVLAAIGIHPGEAIPLTQDVKKHLDELSGRKRVVAFGEIGLEYGRPKANKETQKELLTYQLSLARNAHLPVDIHYSSNAHQDIIDIIKKEKGSGLSGIVHGFQGNLTELQDWLDLDFYISIGVFSLGIWRPFIDNSPPIADEVVRAIPADRLLTETDSMARMSVTRWRTKAGPPPSPETGTPTQEEFRQPADVISVAEKIASIRAISTPEIGNITTANLKRILKI